jgi:hypothetical protein
MMSDSENFEQLRKLLSLKRHEIPPPGYFHHFSHEVRIRIKAGERGDARWEARGVSWFQRFWAALDTRPAWAGVFGAGVCGFFVVGAIVASQTVEVPVAEQQPQTVAASTVPGVPEVPGVAAESVMPVSSVAPSLMPAKDSFFDQIQRATAGQAQTFNANYVPANQ